MYVFLKTTTVVFAQIQLNQDMITKKAKAGLQNNAKWGENICFKDI